MREDRIWAAFLRVVTGLVWLFEAYPQVTAASTYLNRDFGAAVQVMANGNPWQFYRQFLEGIVLTHTAVFAYLTLAGNALVGISLVLGLFTPYGAFLGLLLNINYGLASGWMARPNYPLNGLLAATEIVVMALGAGQVAGLDGMIGRGPKRTGRRF